MTATRLPILPATLVLLSMLQGCAAPVFVAGAASGISVAQDRRSAGAIVDDQSIELKAGKILHGDERLPQDLHVVATSYNGVVLLTGQAPDTATRKYLAHRIRKIDKVRRVHNEITLGAPTSMTARSRDTWLTAKVKSNLLRTEGVNGIQVKVVTENEVVFLMGIVTREEGRIAALTAQRTGGVKGVVKVFEYLR